MPKNEKDLELGDENLKDRLRNSWRKSDLNAFCILVDELSRVIGSKYLEDYRKLTFEEFQDCYLQVISKIINDFEAICGRTDNPWLYLWEAVKNEIFSLFKERGINLRHLKQEKPEIKKDDKREKTVEWSDRYSQENNTQVTEADKKNDEFTTLIRAGSNTILIPPEQAQYLLEGLLDEYDFSVQVAKQVVEIALSYLSSAESFIIKIILERGPEYNSQDAEKEYAIRPANYRKGKERAYAKLKTIIPKILLENDFKVGIKKEITIFIDIPSEFPSSEDL